MVHSLLQRYRTLQTPLVQQLHRLYFARVGPLFCIVRSGSAHGPVDWSESSFRSFHIANVA